MNKSEQQLSRELNKRVKKLNDFIVGISKGAEMSGNNTAFFDSVEKVVKPEFKLIYGFDDTFTLLNKQSVLFMIRTNLRFRIIPFHQFGLNIEPFIN